MKEIRFPVSESQVFLLKAIIGNDRTAVKSYKKWIDAVNFTNYIDGESYALIPALYKRLSVLGFDDINMNKYKGIYKKAFYKNSLLLNLINTIGAELNSRKIPVTVLKGIPMLINYLGDMGVRSMGDVDMVVDRENVPDTIKILEAYGFRSDCGYNIYENIESRHSYSFSNDKDLEIDLYWTSIPVSYENVKLDALREFTYKGVILNMLVPEDLIFQVCLHGASWDPVVSIRWIFDLHTILQEETEIVWKKLLARIANTRLPYVFYLQFMCFNEISSLKIPDWVIQKLYENGNNRLCRKHAKIKIIRPKTIFGRIGWYGYSLHFQDRSFIYRLTNYPRHRLMMSRYDRYRDLLAAYIRKYVLKKKEKNTNRRFSP